VQPIADWLNVLTVEEHLHPEHARTRRTA
jgi:hypothetical protein